MTIVTLGGFGHGKAQPIIQIIGKRATCALKATQKASIKGTLSFKNAKVSSLVIKVDFQFFYKFNYTVG